MTSILEDCLYNIVSDTVLKVHREEKIARMQSAAIIAQEAQEKAVEEDPSSGEAHQTITTAGAYITPDGKINLHDNPFRTTPEILCPTCRLSRLPYPTTGKNSQPPQPGKDYCAKQPYIEKDGCDIYGKSLALEKPTNKNKKAAKDPKSAASPDNSESPDGTPTNGRTSDKPAVTTIPQAKCPKCPRYVAITRIAQHLDRCMGISGRQASKDAEKKMKERTPRDSRASTPKPNVSNIKKRKLDKGSDDETEEGTPKKKKKLVSKKLSDAASKHKAVNSNLQRVKGAEKRLPGQPDAESRGQSSTSKVKEKDVKPKEAKDKESKKKEGKEKSPDKDSIKESVSPEAESGDGEE